LENKRDTFQASSFGSGTIEVELTWVERFMTQREEGNVQD